ncbi:MAG: hypothetical protein CTY39_08990 [Hyphomicrobium sp.]|nr:MAG: hypothetical protein CTY39_08990 [Hyphomicrobium sp.]
MCAAGAQHQYDHQGAAFRPETGFHLRRYRIEASIQIDDKAKLSPYAFVTKMNDNVWMSETAPVRDDTRTMQSRVPFFTLSLIALLSFGLNAAGANESPNPPSQKSSSTTVTPSEDITLDQFLDRLMMAESGGRAFAKNPLSTAVGPFQFIASTWLLIARKTFSADILSLKTHEILALRTVPSLARQAAKTYTQDNAAYLVAKGHPATFTNLRLAFLAGPNGATRILSAKQDTPVAKILGPLVMRANPFMTRLTANDIIARAARDIASNPESTAGLSPDETAIAEVKARGASASPETRPKISVACNLTLPKCKRWLALATRRAMRPKRVSRN